MFVCICNAITEKEIIKSISNGNDTLVKIQKNLGVETSCGCCIQMIQSLITNSKYQQMVK